MPIFDLALGTLAPDLLGERETWKRHLVAYGPRGGFEPLRKALAQKEEVSPACIVVTSGASMALTAALGIVQKHRAVLMPRPYYPAYPHVARLLGLDIAFYNLLPRQRWIEGVSAAARANSIGAILVNSPGNPLGNVVSTEEIAELAEIARQADAILLLDETYAGILLDPPANTWSGSGVAPGTIRLKSLSKAYLLAGERIGYTVAEAPLADKIEEVHWIFAMSPAVTAQTNAARALLDGDPKRLTNLCGQLRRSRNLAVSALADIPGIEVCPPVAGVFLWVEFPAGGGRSGEDIARHCREQHGLAVMPGEACGQREPPAIRVSFARSETDAAEAFRVLARALLELQV